jgi:DinB superfamily
MQPLSVAPIHAPVSLLEKTPVLLEILLRDVPEEVLVWKPAAERWSIAEVLDHLVMIEKLYGERAHRIVTEDHPTLTKYVAPPDLAMQTRMVRQSPEEFGTLRRALVTFLHSIPASSAERSGQHVELGRITLSEMLHELANHDLGHLRQIAEIYRGRVFYRHAGPFQKYSHPNP